MDWYIVYIETPKIKMQSGTVKFRVYRNCDGSI